jgi:hypothetical protein
MWHTWETEELHTVLWWGDLRETDHLEDLTINGKIILKCLQEVEWEGRDRIYLAKDRDRRRTFVDVVMNIQIP